MRNRIKKLLICICMGALFVACNNETVILNNDEEKPEKIEVEVSKNESVKKSDEVKKTENIKENDKKEGESKPVIKVSDSRIEDIMEKIEEIHPNPYKNTQKEIILQKGNDILKEKEDTYLALKEILSLYGDISLGLQYDENSREKIDLYIKGDDRGIFLFEDKGNLLKGDRLIKIGNMDIEKIMTEAQSYYPMKREGDVLCRLDDVLCDKGFLESLGLLKNGGVKIEVLRGNISVVENVGFRNGNRHVAPQNGYEFMDDNKVAILNVDSFKGEKDIDTIGLMEDFFDDVNLLKSETVVIDLRGDKEIDTYLLNVIGSYLPVDEYNDYKKDVKESDAWKDGDFKKDGFFKKIFKSDRVKIKREKGQNYRFEGELYVLMNGKSGTSQYKIASILKEDFAGKIIGNPSWRSESVFGDNVEIMLEGFGEKLSIPTTEFHLGDDDRFIVDIFSERLNGFDDYEEVIKAIKNSKK